MRPVTSPLKDRLNAVSEALRGPQLLVFGLAFVLALIWFGAQVIWLALPFALIATLPRQGTGAPTGHDPAPGQLADMALAIERRLARARGDAQTAPCLFLGIDGFAAIRARHGPQMQTRLVTNCLDHLARALRPEDRLFDLGQGRFGVLLAADRSLTGAAIRQIAHRLELAALAATSAMLASDALGISSSVEMIQPRARPVTPATIGNTLATLGRNAGLPPSQTLRPPPPLLAARARPRDGPKP
jgi:GGDEF domain-containing protein